MTMIRCYQCICLEWNPFRPGATVSALGAFRVDPTSGVIQTTSSFDYESGITYYDVTVQAADRGAPSRSITRTLRIGVQDVNDNAPVFSDLVYDATTTEGDAVTTGVIQLVATDADSLAFSPVYSIVSGNGAGKFAISGDKIQILAVIDLDTPTGDPDSYELGVEVTDGTLTGSATVYVVVQSTNDHDPVFGVTGTNPVSPTSKQVDVHSNYA